MIKCTCIKNSTDPCGLSSYWNKCNVKRYSLSIQCCYNVKHLLGFSVLEKITLLLKELCLYFLLCYAAITTMKI